MLVVSRADDCDGSTVVAGERVSACVCFIITNRLLFYLRLPFLFDPKSIVQMYWLLMAFANRYSMTLRLTKNKVKI
jgi:hypothetical protein